MVKVSVVIITYNRSELLKNAINSVLSQSFEDFELLVIDDCSPDDTKEVVKEFNDSRIRYICHETNEGEGGARNTSLRHVQGEYVSFLDDDDEWYKDKLQLQVSLLDSKPLDFGVVHTGQVNFYADTGKEITIQKPKDKASGDIFQALIEENFITVSSILVRKSCFEEVGIFDQSIPAGLDYDMWLRIAQKYKFLYIDQPLVKYRMHQHKLGTNYALQVAGQESLIKKYEEYFTAPSKANCRRHMLLGILYCLNNNVRAGRKVFLKAISLHPLSIKPYLSFILSFSGNKNFQRIHRMIFIR